MSSVNKEKLISIAEEFISPSILSDEKNWDRALSQLGVDSLDMMTVFLNVQEKFGLKDIPEEEIDQLQTLNRIIQYIEKAQNGSNGKVNG